MCGIAGIIGGKGATKCVENMLEAMHHRGPDDWGTFEEENVVLGHKRLSIIDLSLAGRQPMTNQKGNITIAFNGEIYNYQELKALLPKNLILKSTTDTEVILELWEKYGTGLFEKLRGMFAMSIWNKDTKQLILARDHMGIKPLYYWQNNSQLVFASEVKGMLASGLIEKKINNNSISNYLQRGYILQPNTIIENLYMLPPATFLTFRDGISKIETYWKIEDKSDIKVLDEKQAIDIVRKLVVDSVKEELISERPSGVFLSGGLDSTIILASIKELGIKNTNTYSVNFDLPFNEEISDAEISSNFYSTNHTVLNVNDEMVLNSIEDFIDAIDQPSIDGFNTFLVSKIASNYVTVALSGLGGDELFSGYSIDRTILKNRKYEFFFKLIKSTEVIWNILPTKITHYLNAFSNRSSLSYHYSNWGGIFELSEIKKLIKFDSRKKDFKNLDIGKKYNPIQRISYLHLRGFMLNRLLRDGDSTSMYHSLEIRFPFIDKRLVNFVFNLPMEWKVKNLNKPTKYKKYEQESSYERDNIKHLLFSAFKDSLPKGFGSRPKRGFHFPVEKWIKTILNEEVYKTLNNVEYLDQKHVNKVLEQYFIYGSINWTKVWALFILEKWLKKNLK